MHVFSIQPSLFMFVWLFCSLINLSNCLHDIFGFRNIIKDKPVGGVFITLFIVETGRSSCIDNYIPKIKYYSKKWLFIINIFYFFNINDVDWSLLWLFICIHFWLIHSIKKWLMILQWRWKILNMNYKCLQDVMFAFHRWNFEWTILLSRCLIQSSLWFINWI